MYEISSDIFLIKRHDDPFLTVLSFLFIARKAVHHEKRYSAMNFAPCNPRVRKGSILYPQTLESYTKAAVAKGERKRKSANCGKTQFQKRGHYSS